MKKPRVFIVAFEMEIASGVCWNKALEVTLKSREILNKTFRKRIRSWVFGDKGNRDETIRPTVLNNNRSVTES